VKSEQKLDALCSRQRSSFKIQNNEFLSLVVEYRVDAGILPAHQ
jgi:hypothetical protein